MNPVDQNQNQPTSPQSLPNGGQQEAGQAPLQTPEVNKDTPAPSPDNQDTADQTGGGANVYKEKVKEKSLGVAELSNMNNDGGINLIPVMTKEEALMEQRKSGINYFSVFMALFIALLSVGIVGFNFINRSILKNEKEELASLEQEVRKNATVIDSNDAILQRVELYQQIQQSTFSPKEVFLYWLDLSNEFGEIERVELSGGLDFSFTGQADNLIDAARLWHLLSVDSRVSEIELESVSKTENGVNYRFNGSLDFEYFVANQAEDVAGATDSRTE